MSLQQRAASKANKQQVSGHYAFLDTITKKLPFDGILPFLLLKHPKYIVRFSGSIYRFTKFQAI